MFKKIITTFLLRGVPAIIVFAGFIALYNYLIATKPQVASEPAAPQIWTVSDFVVTNQTSQPLETAYGTVVASRKADLRFSVQGEVSWISPALRNGALVQEGEELARLDTTRYELALDELLAQIAGEQAQSASLQKQLDLRKKTLERTKNMASQNVVSDANLDEAELAVAVTESQLIASQSRIAQLRVAERSRRKDISDSSLKAPFTGTLSDVAIGLGQIASNAAPIGRMTDQSSLEVPFVAKAEIYANAPQLLGQTVTVTWQSGARDVATAKAFIARTNAELDKIDGGGRLYAELIDAEASGIRPGAFVKVTFIGRSFDNVASIPEEALFGDNLVYINEGGVARSQLVDVVWRAPGEVYIKGLRDGTRLIATRLPAIGDGVRVRAVGGQSQ
ncbi:MAG: efflux RND transporter periplasmic adaptor subunit [Candidatus Puniceispirillaceae bacterium]